MKNVLKRSIIAVIVTLIVAAFAVPAFAEEAEPVAIAEEVVTAAPVDNVIPTKAIAAGAAIAVVAAVGAVSMAIAIHSSVTAISRQPEAAGDVRTGMMLGLVFIETAIIYALIVAILIIFVL